MKHILANPRRWGACLVLGLAAIAVGLWASQQRGETSQGEPAPNPDVPAAEVLAALPQPKTPRLVDGEIARRTETARRNERNPSAWAALGEALMQKARETADAAYYGHAERCFRKALAIDSRHGDAVTGLAWVEGCRHEFEKSAEWAEKAVVLDARNNRAYGLLGDAAAEMGDYDAALRHYQKMLDIRPDVSSYSRGAHLLFLTGDVRKGTFLMQKALESGAPYAENRAWCQAQLALMYFNTGALVAAEQTLALAEGGAADDPHVLAVKGKLMAARKDYAGAIAAYKKAADAAPLLDVLIPLADLYTVTGDVAEAAKAVEVVETVHSLNKANGVRGDAMIALFHADRGRDVEEAVRLAEEEYKTRKSVSVADALAWCYYKAGRYAEAQTASKQARSKKTPEAAFLYHSGMIYAKLGDRPAAQLHLYQALSLNPNFHPIHAKAAEDALAELGSRQPTGGAELKGTP